MSEMIEEAATVACILREPDLVDMLQVPDLSLFSPPAPIPDTRLTTEGKCATAGRAH